MAKLILAAALLILTLTRADAFLDSTFGIRASGPTAVPSGASCLLRTITQSWPVNFAGPRGAAVATLNFPTSIPCQ